MEVDEITPTGAAIQDEEPVVPVVDETVIEPKAETDGETPEDTSTPSQTFTQKEVDAIVKQRLERANKAAEAKTAKAREEAERASLLEQQKYQELYEKAQADLEVLNTEKAALERQAMIQGIVTEVGLPPELVSRLQGETEDEIRADAVELVKIFGSTANTKKIKPNINSGQQSDISPKYTENELTELSETFGISRRVLDGLRTTN